MGDTVNLVNDHGEAITVSLDDAAGLVNSGEWHAETGGDVADRAVSNVREDIYGGTAAAGITAGVNALNTVTGGGSNAALAALGHGDTLRKFNEQHELAATGGSIAGAFLPTGAVGLAARAGEGASAIVRGESALAKLAQAGVKTGTEGFILGAGQGVGEFALSDDLSIEHAASAIGSNALFGAGTGAAIGVAGKGIEIGLTKAKGKLDRLVAEGAEKTVTDAATADLASLDRNGLRAAEKAETEAIEAARAPRRAELADEIKSFRQELKQNKVWLATKDAEDAEVRAIGKRTFKADKALDNLLDDPKALADSPKAALRQLRIQEAGLDDLVTKHGEKLRAAFAGDASSARAAALDYASVALEKNRALQAKITEVSGKAASPRLEAIHDALAGLGQATKKENATIGDILTQSAMGHAVGLAAGVPYLGQAVLAAKAVGSVFKKLGGDTAAVAARGSKAIQTFLDVGSKVAPTARLAARLAATRTLAGVRYGDVGDRDVKPAKKGPALAEVYQARSSELRNLTAPGPEGKPVMRMEARQKMADRLAPIRVANPVLADRIETNRARAVEFLAEKLPKKPDLAGMVSDKWHPSDMEMRGFARYVAAVEDPHGVIERLSTGEVTPEDAEAMRAVYPEMYADVQRQIMMQLGEIQSKLPYQRRLALSIFSGVPTDPTLDPRVLSALQASFANEAGTDGGVMAPRAEPAFGSVSKEKPTAAQERSA